MTAIVYLKNMKVLNGLIFKVSIILITIYQILRLCPVSFNKNDIELFLERGINMNQEEIGKFISELRKEKNMTQEQLAEKMGVTGKSISRWENGKTMPDISILSILANELNCSVSELLNGRKMTKEELIDLRETINNVIEYESNQQIKNDKRLNNYNIISFITLTMIVINNMYGYLDYIFSSNIADFIQGFLYGICLWSIVVSIYNHSHKISICEKKKALIRKFNNR